MKKIKKIAALFGAGAMVIAGKKLYDKYKYINTKITFNVRKNRLVGNSNKLNNVKINAVRVLIL